MQRSRPTLRQLELFLTLSTSDGIASAGARLGMSASATSHALRALEHSLGVELIDRNAPGVTLTHTGKQVLAHARDMFASLQLVQATAQAGAGLKSGWLQLGSFGASATLRVLPAVMERFRKRYPGINLTVTERPDEITARDISERRLELAALTLPKPDFDSHTLAIDKLVVVLPEHHPLAQLDPVPLKALVKDPFILTRAGSETLVRTLFANHGLQPAIAFELLQLTSILELVRAGKGISMLARLALPNDYPGIVFRAVSPGMSRRIGLACLDQTRLSPLARAFWNIACQMPSPDEG